MQEESDGTSSREDEIEAERLAIRKRAMNMLARREHAPAELAAKLEKRDHDRDLVTTVLDELIDDGLLSAARYVDAVVRSKAERCIGPVRIRAELIAAGIDDALADDALANAELDWFVQAAAARRKRFGAEPPVDFPAKAKQMRFLQQRGFSGDEIAAAVK